MFLIRKRIQRIREWINILRIEGVTRVPWFKMVRLVFAKKVPHYVWRERMRTCMRCPVYNRATKACRSPIAEYRELGCGCATFYVAMVPAPYPNGCWATTTGIKILGGKPFGWGAWHAAK